MTLQMAGPAMSGETEKTYTANFTWYMFFSCFVAGTGVTPVVCVNISNFSKWAFRIWEPSRLLVSQHFLQLSSKAFCVGAASGGALFG